MTDDDFMKMMGLSGGPIGLETTPVSELTNFGGQDYTDPSATKEDVNAMKKLMEKMSGEIEYVADVGIRNPETNKDIERMIISESNKDKVWQIRESDGNGRTEYQIYNVQLKNHYEGVYLLESANKICKLLEEDHAVNSKGIQTILYYDSVYRTNFDECANLKRIYKSAKLNEDYRKANIMSDKFEVAKERAISAKNSIKRL